MKIQKFNESLENIKECVVLIISNSSGPIHSGAFETTTIMENWLLNLINEQLVSHISSVKTPKGVAYNEDGELIFIDVYDAINWYQEYFGCDVIYDEESSFITNEKVKYGVELARTKNKYNV